VSGHENTIFCLFFSSPSSDAEAKNSHQIFSLLNHRRRQGEKFFSRRGRGGRKSKKKGGKRGKKSALNNKVRNRFFHVTQFTRDEKKKVALNGIHQTVSERVRKATKEEMEHEWQSGDFGS
jgi:hypothetical protein